MTTQNFQQGTMRLNIHPLKAVNYITPYLNSLFSMTKHQPLSPILTLVTRDIYQNQVTKFQQHQTHKPYI